MKSLLLKKWSKDSQFITLCLAPAVLLVAIFTYYPILNGIKMAFQNYTLFDLRNVHFIGLDNFKAVLSSDLFYQAALNSVYWVFFSLFLQFTIGFAVALYLKRHFKGRGLYQAFVFFPWAISGFLIGLIWRWLFNGQFGVINDLLLKIGIIDERIYFLADPEWAMASVIIANVWYGITFFAIMIMAALQSIPEDLYEAADIDGANSFQQLVRVTIPFIMPTLIATILLRTIWILNFPGIIYGMTGGGPAGTTHILTTYMLDKTLYGQDYGQAAAIAVIILVILVMFSVFYLLATKFEKAGDF